MKPRRGTYRALVTLILGLAVTVFVIQMVALSRLSSPVARYPWEEEEAEKIKRESVDTARGLPVKQHDDPLHHNGDPGFNPLTGAQGRVKPSLITGMQSTPMPPNVAVQPIHFCDIKTKDALSAIDRAKTESCKNMIRNITCTAEAGKLYDVTFKNLCPIGRNPARRFQAVPYEQGTGRLARVVFLMSIHGRAFRQVQRLFKALYHKDHYFFIHIDSRSDYLYRQVSEMVKPFPNVYIPNWRIATIWGGASLLQMLLRSIEEIETVLKEWDWDFFINMSESDYPLKNNHELMQFLRVHRNSNFVKSHGGDINKFVQKQGLDRTFVECENHMWRVGNRPLPHDVTIDGGSDWIVLNRNYSRYLATDRSHYLTELKHYYKYSLLPAESFFHTVLRNGPMCATFVRSNLRITNWNRRLGCRCQYKHIVDWCGCSPNDFLSKDIDRLRNSGDSNFFARKFEAIVNQKIINEIDAHLYGAYPPTTPGLNSYWENVFHDDDDVTQPSSARYTVYNSFMRLGQKQVLTKESGNQSESSNCPVPEHPHVQEVFVYRKEDKFSGFIVQFKEAGSREILEDIPVFEVLMTPVNNLVVNQQANSDVQFRVFEIEVGSEWDGKESIFRNHGGILGVYDEPQVALRTVTGRVAHTEIIFEDPIGTVASNHRVKIDAGATVIHHKSKLSKPLRPGVWKVVILHSGGAVYMSSTFMVTPVKYDKKTLMNDPSSVNGKLARENPPNGANKERFEAWSRLSLSVGRELDEWVDGLASEFWQLHGVCSTAAATGQCRSLISCEETHWSTLSPDPKSELGPVQPNGRLR